MTIELPERRPERFDADTLLALRANPPRMGQWAMERRRELYGERTLLRPTVAVPEPALDGPAILRRDELLRCSSWPAPEAWQSGDRLLLPVAPEDEAAARRYVEWLLALAARQAADPIPANQHLGPCSLAPFSGEDAGTHRLWLIATARLALPGSLRVEARHDLIGIRLAQVALGYGADTLSGPIDSDRKLPVAGVPRPTEATISGLRKLIEQAGLVCALREDAAPRVLDAGRYTVPMSIPTSIPTDDPKSSGNEDS